ncbi:RNA pseudouridine synthase 2 [Forsythia ovata]|uniref:RNA pseudouridine synthase 2 n=1 Tax=Forsythia ovata TaxID=205694 RepID=A0ABD1UB91_9LAMI
MLSLNALSWTSIPSAKALSINPRHSALSQVQRIVTACFCSNPNSISARDPESDGSRQVSGRLNKFSGIKLEETVGLDFGKLRLDSWLSSRINGVSRARVQSSIRSGLVSVNGRVVSKVTCFSSVFTVLQIEF